MSAAQLAVGNNLWGCWQVVEGLDLKAKSRLMGLLANDITNFALRKNADGGEDTVFKLAGSWKDDRTADEMVADIYSARVSSSRVLESFDD